MKRTFSDGRREILLDPRDFLIRLCALIPPRRFHMIRYFGAFAAHARDCSALTGQRPKQRPKPADPTVPPTPSVTPSAASRPWPSASVPVDDLRLGAPPPDPDRPPRLDWAALLQRVHKIDVLTCPCGARLQVIAFLTDPVVTGQILNHLGLADDKPVRPPVRAPPQLHLPGLDANPPDLFVDPPSPWT